MKKPLIYFTILLGSICNYTGCKGKTGKTGSNIDDGKIKIIVSILPQKFFVERITGSKADVTVIVQPGQSPATYEPSPVKMAKISEADIYFSIGVPFEKAWIDKIKEINRNLTIVDSRKNIIIRKMESIHSFENTLPGESDHAAEINVARNLKKDTESHYHDDGSHGDPHIWLNPDNAVIITENIYKTLSARDPGNIADYKKNLDMFRQEIEILNDHITKKLKKVRKRTLPVYHPSMGYYAERFGLKQLPVEIEGKEPGQRSLSKIIGIMKKNDLKVIFVQKQFSTKSAETIARAINGHVELFDPLSGDYISNLKNMTDKIYKGINRK